MTLELFDKLSDLIKDLDTSDGVGYSTWEVDFLESMRSFDKHSNISFNQEIKIEETWEKHLRYRNE